MPTLDAHNVTIPGNDEDGGLAISLVRYQSPSTRSRTSSATERLSLIFVHGVSSHKESWLPTIEHIFQLQASAPNDNFAVLEAWSMDSPNHGQAAITNEHLLMERPGGITAYQWGRAVQVLLKSGLIDSKCTGVIGIGHSAGACVITLSTVGYSVSDLPYSSMILVEPPMMTEEILTRSTERHTPLLGVIELAKKRQDIWPSREAAKQWLAKRLPWRRWAPESLDLYVQHALRDLPTAAYPDQKDGVTLCCTRVQESAGYIYHQDGIDSLDRLKELCRTIPVHTIFGGRPDMVPEETQMAIIDEKQGRRMASVVKVTGAGHLVPQEDPKGLAIAIWGTLHHSRPWKSRL